MPRRILVCTGYVPFVTGGAERMADALVSRLRERGHHVDLVRLPFTWHTPESILSNYTAWRLLDLSRVEWEPVDMVIALKFPAYAVAHENKVVWLIQQFRQMYDLFGTPYSPYNPASPEDQQLRAMIHRIDCNALGESRRLFTISRNVANRLETYNGLRASVLYPPPPLDERLHCAAYGDYVLSVSRLDQLKRVDRLIEAMSYVKSPLRCRIVGDGPESKALHRMARQLGVADRVDFLGAVDDQQVIDLYAHALAVYYAPYDEDYGLATVEAMKSAKPVVTFADSGGVLEFVDDTLTGYIVPPQNVKALAERLDALYQDRALAKSLGQAAQERVASFTWERTLNILLGE